MRFLGRPLADALREPGAILELGAKLPLEIRISALLTAALAVAYLLSGWLHDRARRRRRRRAKRIQAALSVVLFGADADAAQAAAQLARMPRPLLLDMLQRLSADLSGESDHRLRALVTTAGLTRPIRARLRSRSWRRRAQGAALASLLPDGDPRRATLLNDAHPTVRARAAERLDEDDVVRLADQLIALLDDDVQAVRFAAQQALLRGDARIVPALERYLSTGEGPGVIWALEIAANLPDPRLGPVIRRHMQSSDARRRAIATEAIGPWLDEPTALMELLLDPDAEVRATAARVVGRTRKERLAAHVGRLLSDPVWQVRQEAGRAWPPWARRHDDASCASRRSRSLRARHGCPDARHPGGAPYAIWTHQRLVLGEPGGMTIAATVVAWVVFGTVAMTIAAQVALYVCAGIELKRIRRRDRHQLWRGILFLAPRPSREHHGPAYNESVTVVESVTNLLSLTYSNLEVVVVNDGSRDDTMAVLIDAFKPRAGVTGVSTADPNGGGNPDLPVARRSASRRGRQTQRRQGRQPERRDQHLDGRAGLRHRRRHPRHAELTATARLSVPRVGGHRRRGWHRASVERRGMEATSGQDPTGVEPAPRRRPSRRVSEGVSHRRLAWNILGGNLIISGAFGVFRKDALFDVGGYEHRSIGEDMELVVRLRRKASEEGRRALVVFTPDPVAFTGGARIITHPGAPAEPLVPGPPRRARPTPEDDLQPSLWCGRPPWRCPTSPWSRRSLPF